MAVPLGLEEVMLREELRAQVPRVQTVEQEETAQSRMLVVSRV
jgi:hypothetical protein